MITHHPSEEFIAAYAAGTLDEAQALAIAAHLTLCPACRHQNAEYEMLGATMLEDLPEMAFSSDAFAATLERVRNIAERPAAPSLPSPHAPKSAILLPAPVRHYLGGDIDLAKWRALGPGIHHMPLVSSDGGTARLLRIAPGRSVFDHTHAGSELTLVLRGSYSSQGERFTRGDLEIADESVNHRPVAGTEDICICLAVTEAPLRFDNWLGRLMQPFLGV